MLNEVLTILRELITAKYYPSPVVKNQLQQIGDIMNVNAIRDELWIEHAISFRMKGDYTCRI